MTIQQHDAVAMTDEQLEGVAEWHPGKVIVNKSHVCCFAVSMTISMTAACGGGSSPVTPSTVSVSATPTITISETGVSPAELRISVGQKVRFVNNTSQTHEMRSNPYPIHTDCPAINELPVLSAGQSGLTGALTEQRTCGYHDHQQPQNQEFQGVILVGVSESGGSSSGY